MAGAVALAAGAPPPAELDSYLKTEDIDLGKNPPPPKIEKLPDGKIRMGVMTLDPVKRQIVMPGEIATWERNIEVLIASPRGHPAR